MPQRLFAVLLVGLVAVAGCRTGQVQSDDQGTVRQAQQARLPSADAIPSGTEMRIALDQKLSTETTREGDGFTAELVEPLVSVDGETVVPAGATVRGEVTGLVRSNRPDEQAAIRLHIDEVEFDGQTYRLPARIVQTGVETERDKSDIAGGAAVGGVAGAALGAIIGEGAKGALIGGALGAGAGTVVSLGYGRTDAELPAGSEMVIRTTRSIDLDQRDQ